MKKRMSTLDATFIQVERHEAPQHGAVLFLLTPPADAGPDFLAELAADMRAHPVTSDKFNYVLAGGPLQKIAPAWQVLEPDEIDIDYHFRHSALPRPGGELELATLVSRLVTHPLELNRPLWELHLIEGLENGRFAILLKMHHALLDGLGVLKLLHQWLSEDPTERDAPPIWALPPTPRTPRAPDDEVRPNRLLAVGSTARKLVDGISGITRALADDVRAAGRTEPGLVAPYSAPRTVLNGQITQRRRISTQRLELERVRRIASTIDGTVNDAIAVTLATALRRYLLELDELPDRPLVAGVLASLRATLDERNSNQAGNAISFIFADLATEIEDIPTRAERVVASTKAGKEHLLGLQGKALAYSSLMLAPFALAGATGLGHHVAPLLNVGLSNAPGTKVPQYHNGSEVDSLHATTIIGSGAALVVTVTSWNKHLSFTITACPDAVPHCQRISIYLAEALDEVEAALGLA